MTRCGTDERTCKGIGGDLCPFGKKGKRPGLKLEGTKEEREWCRSGDLLEGAGCECRHV